MVGQWRDCEDRSLESGVSSRWDSGVTGEWSLLGAGKRATIRDREVWIVKIRAWRVESLMVGQWHDCLTGEWSLLRASERANCEEMNNEDGVVTGQWSDW
ncbi:hypothetical protein Patl1_22487 [Pistacia atlantica]|uniref:Uncharacterized protein n=1 Tax=Pistacia atlantica TaxID=434234 RepID=A0ACC1A1T5_9ROSI|nr:hypothetical protein Patl1_22487 [Pistacia atlantica]